MTEPFAFRDEMVVRHKRIDLTGKSAERNELVLPDPVSVSGGEIGAVAGTAVDDFCDFLGVAFGRTGQRTETDDAFLLLELDASLSDCPIRFRISADDRVRVTGADERSLAQALYYLEFLLKVRGFPALTRGVTDRRMPYSPRMVHSGYGLDQYPDEYLSSVAHYGYDAILIFVTGVDQTTSGYLDFNDLTARAARFGIDVYAYCYISNFTSPADEGSRELYENLYGKIFESCPRLKGMIFVGESVEFDSKDEHVAHHRHGEAPKDGVIETKPTPGWWPCYDYKDWIALVRDSIRKYKPDADIVFWTYNWGWAPRDARLRLIDSLPTDISLLVTFEMFQKYEVMGIEEIVSDYSLAHPHCGSYFRSEAAEAKAKGIRLYSMTNTAGRTWDFGTVPYLPMPSAWQERFDAVNEARREFGLCGLMEGHHYGFTPNFISRLAYLSFMEGGDGEDGLSMALREEFGTDDPALIEGLRWIGESIRYIPPTVADQYGPLRVGTCYPLCLKKGIQPKDYENVHFGNQIWDPIYGKHEGGIPYALREAGEMRMLKKMIRLLEQGISVLNSVRSGEIDRLINLTRYLLCCVRTCLNVKRFYYESVLLKTNRTRPQLDRIIERIEKIAKEEIENAEESVRYLNSDSSLGFEPTMLYANSPERVAWKIGQVNDMLKKELSFYKAK